MVRKMDDSIGDLSNPLGIFRITLGKTIPSYIKFIISLFKPDFSDDSLTLECVVCTSDGANNCNHIFFNNRNCNRHAVVKFRTATAFFFK